LFVRRVLASNAKPQLLDAPDQFSVQTFLLLLATYNALVFPKSYNTDKTGLTRLITQFS